MPAYSRHAGLQNVFATLHISYARAGLFVSCTQVNLSSINLGVEGVKALADCLKSNTTITQVC